MRSNVRGKIFFKLERLRNSTLWSPHHHALSLGLCAMWFSCSMPGRIGSLHLWPFLMKLADMDLITSFGVLSLHLSTFTLSIYSLRWDMRTPACCVHPSFYARLGIMTNWFKWDVHFLDAVGTALRRMCSTRQFGGAVSWERTIPMSENWSCALTLMTVAHSINSNSLHPSLTNSSSSWSASLVLISMV